MNTNLNKAKFFSKQVVAICVVVLIGVVLGFAILKPGKVGEIKAHDHHDEAKGHDHDKPAAKNTDASPTAPTKGVHGGRLFTAGDYGLELTIYEKGVEPHFRAYTFKNGKPSDPSLSQLIVTVGRLGAAPQVFNFKKENDYLKTDATVAEPHSFIVNIAAQSAGKSYAFNFEQIEARVTMTDAQLKAGGVEIATAGPKRVQSTLPLLGDIKLNEDRTVRVVPRLAGVVESVAVSAGDKVRKGQVMAVLSSQALADQRSDFLAAQKRVALARVSFDREKKLWEEKISAEQDYLQARQILAEAEITEQSARQKLASLGTATLALAGATNLTRHEIRAPIDGVITDKNIAVGEAIKDDANIFTVADLSTVWVDVTVYAKDLNAIKIGQQVMVKTTAFNAEAAGKISYVGAVVGDQTRTAKARIVLPNPKGIWRAGLAVNITLVADEVEVPIAVTADAIQTLRDWTVVFARFGDQLEARLVTLGRSDGKYVEVLSGLNAGDRYAAANSYLIKADIGKAGASHDH